ncbi:uncharacterized protein SPPG_00168 [Spizellomyces punctatus DAOM BR117]|uniref:Uncharacterized protein n=1 Tax=Spizellomyces punctatus (strain DAOM BR117) TaxID=645134 RepID=A0A0L0HU86_SPIPD|nr:uncharacterized protein SPPG_00168 [Spizellomyces punctatus DAOM BR117]KND04439.1 hypothetical protein SPPG_00168 [Spizellomyces punctatus DAOM BR117]|eukprot:XP_016612478.1 hypothetical protein SPPG_00168 [Spizellomyces punctatus DAOM BR117]
MSQVYHQVAKADQDDQDYTDSPNKHQPPVRDLDEHLLRGPDIQKKWAKAEMNMQPDLKSIFRGDLQPGERQLPKSDRKGDRDHLLNEEDRAENMRKEAAKIQQKGDPEQARQAWKKADAFAKKVEEDEVLLLCDVIFNE